MSLYATWRAEIETARADARELLREARNVHGMNSPEYARAERVLDALATAHVLADSAVWREADAEARIAAMRAASEGQS